MLCMRCEGNFPSVEVSGMFLVFFSSSPFCSQVFTSISGSSSSGRWSFLRRRRTSLSRLVMSKCVRSRSHPGAPLSCCLPRRCPCQASSPDVPLSPHPHPPTIRQPSRLRGLPGPGEGGGFAGSSSGRAAHRRSCGLQRGFLILCSWLGGLLEMLSWRRERWRVAGVPRLHRHNLKRGGRVSLEPRPILINHTGMRIAHQSLIMSS